MTKLIKNRIIVEDHWHYVTDATIAEGDIIVPLVIWQQYREALLNRKGQLGIKLEPHEEPESVAADLDYFQVVVIHFPSFTDGRGYSSARILRDRYNYQGEIRATGDVLRDQLFYMARCGFNAFEVRADTSIEKALEAFNDFSVTYQAASDTPLPLFRRTPV